MKHDDYPEPTYPRYILQTKPKNIDELLPIARERLRKTWGFAAMGIKPGDKVLIAAFAHQDMDVLELMKRAMIEAGAVKVDHIILTDWGFPAEFYSCADGWRELSMRLLPYGPDYPQGELTPYVKPMAAYLKQNPDYTAIFTREAAHRHVARELNRAMPGMGDKFRGNWLYSRWENLISRANTFPDELHMLIDLKLVDIFSKAAAVHVTDPEGTDMRWEVTEEEAEIWRDNSLIPEHILASTYQTLRGLRTAGDLIGLKVKETPFDRFVHLAKRHLPTVNGVIAGSSNHSGFHPQVKVYIEKGMIRKIEGGGKYGDLWREAMEKYANYHYPGFPEKGWGWFNDCTICTNVKGFRSREGLWHYNDHFSNQEERRRCGVVHWGFGAEHYVQEFLDYAWEHRLPIKHSPHIHNFFTDYEIKMRPTGEWLKILDKGRLTLLDTDTTIRRVASIYGDPDEILKYDWIPAIPGINCPGDYRKDFADNPVPWIREEMEKLEKPAFRS